MDQIQSRDVITVHVLGFQPLRDPVQPRLLQLKRGCLAAPTPASPFTGPLYRLQWDPFTNDFEWGGQRETKQSEWGCAWKAKDQEKDLLRELAESVVFSQANTGPSLTFLFLNIDYSAFLPSFLPTAFPACVLCTFSFSLLLHFSSFPRFCCRESEFWTWFP